MKKRIILLLLMVSLFLVGKPVSAQASSDGSFILAVLADSTTVIEPTALPYTAGQSIKEALLASEYNFGGIESGFIYHVEGVLDNYNLFYDGGGYDLDADASTITCLLLTQGEYSDALLQLCRTMGELNTDGNHALAHPDVALAYRAGLNSLRGADAQQAEARLQYLNAAIANYNAILNGTKHTVSFFVSQNGAAQNEPELTMTDIYGNVSSTKGSSLQVVAGKYSYSVSDGGVNRCEGTVQVNHDEVVNVTLPYGSWFGNIELRTNPDAHPCSSTLSPSENAGEFYFPDFFSGSPRLYAEQGEDCPQEALLYAVYTRTDGGREDISYKRWSSNTVQLNRVLLAGMEGRSIELEARMTMPGDTEWIQSYTLHLRRLPTLRNLQITAGGAIQYLPFEPVVREYEFTAVTDMLTLAAEPYEAEGYDIYGLGEIALTTEETDHVITVCYRDGTESSYILHINKTQDAVVNFDLPQNTELSIFDQAGRKVLPIDGQYRLIPGNNYRWDAVSETYFHTTADFTAADGMRVQVPAPETTNALTALTMGSTRTLNADKQFDIGAFSSRNHEYVSRISDSTSTVYVRASWNGDYTLTARYGLQSRTITDVQGSMVSTVVPADGSVGTMLSKCLIGGGYSQTVVFRLSKQEGGITWYQDYTVSLLRQLHVKQIDMIVDGEKLYYTDADGNSLSYDRDIMEYHATVLLGTNSIAVTAVKTNENTETSVCGGYTMEVNGIPYESLSKTEIPLREQGDETLVIRSVHVDGNSEPLDYVFHIHKTEPVKVDFSMNPTDAVVELRENNSKERIFPQEGSYLLIPGKSYRYSVTKYGYIAQTNDNYVPSEDETISLQLEMAAAPIAPLSQLPAAWPGFRADANNNGIVSARTPIKDEDSALYWATPLGDGWDANACGCPILVDGCVYTYAVNTLYKVDAVSGEILAQRSVMDHSSSFAINNPTYAEGMLFVGESNGTVQAFRADTLEPLWIYEDPAGGQPNCPIVYRDGYVYTGFWTSETGNANYVCLSVTDENPGSGSERKTATWSYSVKGGFYWAGAYVEENFLLVGTDDGAAGYTTGHARLLSFDPKTGEMQDEITLPHTGDQRSSITWDPASKYAYFTTKGGYFYGITVNADGTFPEGALRSIKLYNYAGDSANPAMSTSTPVIYNNRAYIGVSGVGQFNAYSGHNITVLDLNSWGIAYTVRTQGYPQTSGLLSTAYLQESGKVYVYFFDNFTPGKLRILSDSPGQMAPEFVTTETYKGVAYETAGVLFTPVGAQAQYAICSPITDESGTIYFKNDSAQLMALGSTIRELIVKSEPEKTVYKVGDLFDPAGLSVTAVYANGFERDVTKYLRWSEEPLRETDTEIQIEFPYVMYQNCDGQTGVDVEKPFISITLEIAPERGDVDADGQVNLADALLLYRWLREETELTQGQLIAADVNFDGEATQADAVILEEYCNDERDALPLQTDSENPTG